MKFSKRQFALALASAALLAGGAAQAQSALDNVLKSKTLKVAIPTDYPLTASSARHGAAGPGCRDGQADRREDGRQVELVPVTSANRIPYLQTKRPPRDPTLGKNAEREKVIDFSAAYAPFFQPCTPPRA